MQPGREVCRAGCRSGSSACVVAEVAAGVARRAVGQAVGHGAAHHVDQGVARTVPSVAHRPQPARRRAAARSGRRGRRATRSSALRRPTPRTTLLAACGRVHPRRHRERPRDDQALAAQELDAGVVLGHAAWRRLQLLDGADLVAPCVPARPRCAATAAPVASSIDRVPEPVELVGGHLVVAGAGTAGRWPRAARSRPVPPSPSVDRTDRPSCTGSCPWRSARRGTGRNMWNGRNSSGTSASRASHRALHARPRSGLVGLPVVARVVGLQVLVEANASAGKPRNVMAGTLRGAPGHRIVP